MLASAPRSSENHSLSIAEHGRFAQRRAPFEKEVQSHGAAVVRIHDGVERRALVQQHAPNPYNIGRSLQRVLQHLALLHVAAAVQQFLEKVRASIS
jgi:hypothetical protein